MNKVFILNIFLIFILVLIISLFSVYYFKISTIVTNIEKNLDHGCDVNINEIEQPIYNKNNEELYIKKFLIYCMNIIYYCADKDEDLNKFVNEDVFKLNEIIYDKDSHIFGIYITNIKLDSDMIIYRGSLTNSDWVNIDIDVKQDKYPHYDNACVHSGFYKRFNEIKIQLVNIFQNYNSNRKLYISGHSLGSPICVFTSLLIKQKYNNIDNLIYLYALPRMGNQQFATYINGLYKDEELVIYENNADIITQLPLSSTINIKNQKKPFIYYKFDNKFYRYFYCVKKYVCQNHGLQVYHNNIENAKKNKDLYYCSNQICKY